MLDFFRRYQRAIYFVIAVVIIISFSFFGTFSAVGSEQKADKEVFRTVDGSSVTHSELQDMVRFIEKDNLDYFLSPKGSGGNILNDGVLEKDFFTTRTAALLFTIFSDQLRAEFISRLEKEKRFSPYVHPGAGFLSAKSIWTYYAPEIGTKLELLQKQQDPVSEEAINARIELFLNERAFPGVYLAKVLEHQEKQYKWLQPDPTIAQRDFALFGYQSAQDWIGTKSIELIASFIMNTAKIAEQQGYQVSKDEALQSLYENAAIAFNNFKKTSYNNFKTAADCFHAELRRLGFDQARAVAVWQKVLLFRRFMEENSSKVIVDPAPYIDFYSHENQYVGVDLYALPKSLRFDSMSDLQKFEIYLHAVFEKKPDTSNEEERLIFPEKLINPEEVAKVYPELVQSRCSLRYRTINKEDVKRKISLRETIEWQVKQENWDALVRHFNHLGLKKNETEEEKLEALDLLDMSSRTDIDNFSRNALLEVNQNWLEEALQQKEIEEQEFELRARGGIMPLKGISNREAFIHLLVLQEKDPEAAKELLFYTQDNTHYYQIEVIKAPESPKTITFEQAMQDRTMDLLFNRLMEAAYVRIRGKNPTPYLDDSGQWKPFYTVKEKVVTEYFRDFEQLLEQVVKNEEKKQPDLCDWNNKESAMLICRMVPQLKMVQEKIKDKPEDRSQLVRDENEPIQGVFDQFRLIEQPMTIVRREEHSPIDIDVLFKRRESDKTHFSSNQEMSAFFYTITKKGVEPYFGLVKEKVDEAKALIGAGLVEELTRKIVEEMQAKHAFLHLDERK